MPFCRRRSLSTRAPPPNPCSTDARPRATNATLFQMPRRGRYLTQVRDEMLARGIKWCDVRSSNPSRYLFQETTEKIPKRRQRKKKVQREIFRRRARETRRRREKTRPQEWSSQGRAVYRLPALCVRASARVRIRVRILFRV